jgi:hypothetical protein
MGREDKKDSENIIKPKSKSETKEKEIKDNKKLSGVDKTFSYRRGFLRIVIGLIFFLLWIFIGISPTIIFSSSIQEFIGAFSFLVRNPIIFLLVALLNIFIGILVYFTLGIILWAAFHLIWSIRWFYGYFKYRKTSFADVIRTMNNK